MDAVAAVVGEAFACVGRDEFDPLGTPSDGHEQQRLELQREGLPDRRAVEGADGDAVQPDLGRLQEHALHRDAEVDVDVAVLRDGGADDDEGVGFGAGQRQVQLGQGAAQADVGQDEGRLIRQHGAEAQHLPVHRRREQRVDPDDAQQLVAAHEKVRVVPAVAAVAEKQPPERGRRTLRPGPCGLPGPVLLHLAAQIVVCHGCAVLGQRAAAVFGTKIAKMCRPAVNFRPKFRSGGRRALPGGISLYLCSIN